MHVFGGGEEAGVPGENPRGDGENMQLHTIRPQPEIEPGTPMLRGDGANHHNTAQP